MTKYEIKNTTQFKKDYKLAGFFNTNMYYTVKNGGRKLQAE